MATALALTTLSCGVSAAVFETAISGSWDDAEEIAIGGKVRRASTDLEMTFDGGSSQAVGLRFKDIDIPQNAVINKAYIQFTVDENTSAPADLVIQGLTGYIKTFKTNAGNITSRARTSSAVNWSPPPWRKKDGAGPKQRSEDISAIVQELVNQPSWRQGSSNLGFIITGTGERVAVSYNGNKSKAPRLYVEYGGITEPTNQAPAVDLVASLSVTLPQNTVALDATVTDDGLPSGDVTTTWSVEPIEGDGVVTFADPSDPDTTATISGPGTFRLTLTASDGELSTSADTILTVNQIPVAVKSISQVGSFETGQDSDGNWLPVRATDPAGVYIDPSDHHLFIADSEITEIPEVWSEVHRNVFESNTTGTTLFGEYDVSPAIPNQQVNEEAAGIAKCGNDDHFYIVNDDRQRLYRYTFNGSSMIMVDAVNTFPLNAPAGTLDPEGVTCDSSAGTIYVAGGHGLNILVYHYDNGFVLDRVMDLRNSTTVPENIPSDPEGIAFDTESGHLFVMNNDSDEIFEYTQDGIYLGRHSIADFSPKPKQPQGLAIGPSTRTPGKMSFFIADPRVDNNFDPTERDGLIYEAEIERP